MSKLFIVGTPIGNLNDITFRALETLRNCDLIACEDTRVTKKLLIHFNIQKKLISYSKINEAKSAEYIVNILKSENLNVALVSDAGMPLISDPGFDLIKLARLNDIKIEIIPGVNAAISAFALSGLSSTFVFHGFPKERSGQRKEQLTNLDDKNAHIFYISPHKIDLFLNDIENIWGEKCELFLARELTKIHESQYYGTIFDIKNQLKNDPNKGEFTVVIKIKESQRTKVNKYAKFSKFNN
ncbi:Hypothetical protein, putative tetrapyrrole methylase family protein [Mycoplasmopsis bovigenitalium 51080]|uniref:Ribosomal RNA small subunit methyltransferase I n=1 Tax=Mycoplasmopsis bovigenitalium 51080 TaxID=1188235 RepID=N9VDX7_9BACT|nr:16S rRNA (cytidine(1402)-2'-O)-methyltransferase [Mycoplasmopsis bovigenitalium]ENY69606.1 Hypothetical protein, putative tetrapyrrole methylase family protein [Mycoplasmopsis bovigenitalium 51080]